VEDRLAEEALRKQSGQEEVQVVIWSDKVPAIDEGDEVRARACVRDRHTSRSTKS
jgi:hypothetical protein